MTKTIIIALAILAATAPAAALEASTVNQMFLNQRAERLALQPGLVWHKIGYYSDGRIQECIDFRPANMQDEMARARNSYSGITDAVEIVDKPNLKVLVYRIKTRTAGFAHLAGYTTSLDWCRSELARVRNAWRTP